MSAPLMDSGNPACYDALALPGNELPRSQAKATRQSMSNRQKSTRRSFMQAAGAAVAAPYIITSTALGTQDRAPASDRIVMAGIGIGNMGRGDLGAFLGRKDVQYVALCDVRDQVREQQ